MTPDEIMAAHTAGPRTHSRLNCALAEVTGEVWYPRHGPPQWRPHGKRRETDWQPVPRYCTDHNAVHEAEARLSDEQWERYRLELHVLLWGSDAENVSLFRFIRHANAATCTAAMLLAICEASPS